MGDVFEAKVRRVGNSLGIIIPKGVAMSNGFSEGDAIFVALPVDEAAERMRKLRALAGACEGAPPFKRDKDDRF